MAALCAGLFTHFPVPGKAQSAARLVFAAPGFLVKI